MLKMPNKITTVEQIGRQSRDFLKHVYEIRESVFEKAESFPRKDRMVYNEWDALSNHYLLIYNGKPSGAVAVVDWTGLTEILEQQQIDASLRVAKVTKLALLPEARGLNNLLTLLGYVKRELQGFDFVTADVAPPSDNPNDFSRYELGKKYQSIFSLQRIAVINDEGIIRHILGKNLDN